MNVQMSREEFEQIRDALRGVGGPYSATGLRVLGAIRAAVADPPPRALFFFVLPDAAGEGWRLSPKGVPA